MNEETRLKTDTDGILDRCARCGSIARWIINGAECTECAECVIVPLSESRSEIMTAWNRKQRGLPKPAAVEPLQAPAPAPAEPEKKGSGNYTRPGSVKTLLLQPGVMNAAGKHVEEIAAILAANNPGRSFCPYAVCKILTTNSAIFERVGKGVYRMKQNKETK